MPRLYNEKWYELMPRLYNQKWYELMPRLYNQKGYELMPRLYNQKWYELMPRLYKQKWYELMPRLYKQKWYELMPRLYKQTIVPYYVLHELIDFSARLRDTSLSEASKIWDFLLHLPTPQKTNMTILQKTTIVFPYQKWRCCIAILVLQGVFEHRVIHSLHRLPSLSVNKKSSTKPLNIRLVEENLHQLIW